MDPSLAPQDQFNLLCQQMQTLSAQNEALQARLNTVQSEVTQQTTARFGVKPFEPRKPDLFSGENADAEIVEQWLFTVEEYLGLHRVSEDWVKIKLAGGMLRGGALSWYRMLYDDSGFLNMTWATFKEQLMDAFRPVNAAQVARDKLVVLKQDDSVRDYVYKFRSLCLLIPRISEDEMLDRFLRGLRPRIREELMLREVSTLAEAIRMAERCDANFRLTKGMVGRDRLEDRLGGENRPRGEASSSTQGPTPMEINTFRHNRQQLWCDLHRWGTHVTRNCHALSDAKRAPAARDRYESRGGPDLRGRPNPRDRAEGEAERGPFTGECWLCGESGHPRRLCPKLRDQGKAGRFAPPRAR